MISAEISDQVGYTYRNVTLKATQLRFAHHNNQQPRAKQILCTFSLAECYLYHNFIYIFYFRLFTLNVLVTKFVKN